MNPSKKILLITTGDADGIGLEVTAKALMALPKGFFKKTTLCVFVSPFHQKKYITFLKKHFAVRLINSSSKDFSLDSLGGARVSSKPFINLVLASDSPADWIYYLSKVCVRNATSVALVTGPLSKTLIKDSGYSAIGHTEIMAQATGVSSLFMGFVGKYFNVVLLTGHIPLSNVTVALKKLNWTHGLKIIDDFRSRLPNGTRPMALVGVNPHAGEKGMISTGEEDFLSGKIANSVGKIVGPLVPDAAFLRQNWQKYSLYLACYHDQGLIPFKTIHGQDSGVHVTIGLPFTRTSVDHGTAKEIYGKDVANSNSMKEALVLANRLLT